MSGERRTVQPRCQQLLRVETMYWQEKPECGKVARFIWNSDLRGKLNLCRRHANAVGIEHCAAIRKDQG